MLLAVLVAALYEHRLIYSGAIDQATRFNQAFRVAFLAGIYPILLISITLFGLKDYTPGLSQLAIYLLIFGILGCLVLAAAVQCVHL